MAIAEVRETFQREGERTTEGGRLVRSFFVRTTAIGNGPVSVLTASDGVRAIPSIYSTYSNGTESAAFWILKRKTPRQHPDSPLVWTVDCEYEPMDREGDDEPDPVQRPAKYTWRTAQDSREFVVDAYDKKCANTAGEPFDEPTEADRAYAVLVIERNESTFTQTANDPYRNTLNQHPIFGYDVGEGRIVAIDGDSEFDPDYGVYWKVTIEIHFRLSSMWVPNITAAKLLTQDGTQFSGTLGPWDITRRNVGLRYKNTGDTKTDAALDRQGNQYATPVDLAANGTKLAHGQDPFYVVIRPYLKKNWNPLNIE